MLSLLGMIEQCLKAGKKQSWHAASVTNICVGLLAGLKVLSTFFDTLERLMCDFYLSMTGFSAAGFGYITSSTFGTRDNKFGTGYFSGTHW